MSNKSGVMIGGIMMAVGVVSLLAKLEIIRIGWEVLWPCIVIITGVIFHLAAWTGKRHQAGHLVPGGIMITYGFLFLACGIWGWSHMRELWPIFILGPAIGLFELYLFGQREPGLLLTVSILTALSVIFLLQSLYPALGGITVPLYILAAGAITVGASLYGRKRKAEQDDPQPTVYGAAPRPDSADTDAPAEAADDREVH